MSQTRNRGLVIDQDGREVRPDEGAPSWERGGTHSGGFEFHSFGFNARPLSREERLARLRFLADLLDVAFVVPGTRIRYGIEGLVGLIPVVGDILMTAVSLWIVREARALGAPRYLVARMLANVALDGVVGMVPLVGDAFDVAFKANVRNVRLLQRWMERKRP